jgi:hypothetical protein
VHHDVATRGRLDLSISEREGGNPMNARAMILSLLFAAGLLESCGQSSTQAANLCNINSGYAGDDACIPPPDPSMGFQLHYGPSRYDDPAEVGKFLLQPGEETTDCFFLKTPNTGLVFLNEYHGRMRPGSHHMIIYGQGSSVPDGLRADCNQGADSRFLAGAQNRAIDIPRPGVPTAPENQGSAMLLQPNTQVAIQLHYINVTTKPLLREAWVNFIYSRPEDVRLVTEPIFFLAGLNMNIQPGTNTVIRGTAVAPKNLNLLFVTGHRHAHTVRFTAWKNAGGEKSLIYEDYDWHEPYSAWFDSVEQNPSPDPVRKIAGGASGILSLKAGDTIEWECEVVNDGSVALRFSNAVFTGEMCNLFGMYAPSMGTPWSAVNF